MNKASFETKTCQEKNVILESEENLSSSNKVENS